MQGGNAYNIKFGDGFMEFRGVMRLGQTETSYKNSATGSHLTLSEKHGSVSNIWIWRGDGLSVKQNSHATWHKSLSMKNVYIGDRFIQIGQFRFGDVDGSHSSVCWSTNTIDIWRSDATNHPTGAGKARKDYNLNSRKKYGTPLFCGCTVPGHRLVGSTCKPFAGTCANGKLIALASRTQDNHCGSCNSGFSLSNKACKDINECASKNGGCHAKRKCVNTVGSRTCGNCAAGWTNDGATGCKDINECASNNGGCHSKRKCINTAGGRTCGACQGMGNSGATGCVNWSGSCANGKMADPSKRTQHDHCASCDSGYSLTAGKRCCMVGYSGKNCAVRSNRCLTGGNGWVQLGEWRFGMKEGHHWVISHKKTDKNSKGNVVRIYETDRDVHGNVNGWGLWKEPLGPVCFFCT